MPIAVKKVVDGLLTKTTAAASSSSGSAGTAAKRKEGPAKGSVEKKNECGQ